MVAGRPVAPGGPCVGAVGHIRPRPYDLDSTPTDPRPACATRPTHARGGAGSWISSMWISVSSSAAAWSRSHSPATLRTCFWLIRRTSTTTAEEGTSPTPAAIPTALLFASRSRTVDAGTPLPTWVDTLDG